jgi:hypothetical protein
LYRFAGQRVMTELQWRRQPRNDDLLFAMVVFLPQLESQPRNGVRQPRNGDLLFAMVVFLPQLESLPRNGVRQPRNGDVQSAMAFFFLQWLRNL